MPSRIGLPPGDLCVFSVDLVTGARTVISGGTSNQGTGPIIQVPRGIALDTTGTPRLLVVDDILDAVVAVDLANGNRTVLSSGLAPNVTGTGPAIDNPQDLVVDTANNRVLIANKPALMPNELIAVSLTNGARNLLPVTGMSDHLPVHGIHGDGFRQLAGPSGDVSARERRAGESHDESTEPLRRQQRRHRPEDRRRLGIDR